MPGRRPVREPGLLVAGHELAAEDADERLVRSTLVGAARPYSAEPARRGGRVSIRSWLDQCSFGLMNSRSASAEPALSLLQRGADPSGARAAVLGGLCRRRAELVHELLQPGVRRRADLQLESPGGYDDRRRQPRVRGQVYVPGGSAFG